MKKAVGKRTVAVKKPKTSKRVIGSAAMGSRGSRFRSFKKC